MASRFPPTSSPSAKLEPQTIYGTDGPVKLRIATGGAGQTGVLKALAQAFIEFATTSFLVGPISPFRIAWLATDTSLSFNALASSSADIAIVYHPYAAQIAIQQSIALSPSTCLWRDSFNLVGPASNPAGLPTDGNHSIFELFSKLFQAAVRDSAVKFLSRYDKSASNILESRIWSTIGQTPWAEPTNLAEWYVRFVAFPFEALEEAANIGAYTFVDRGTWLTLRSQPGIKDRLICFKQGAINWIEKPPNYEVGYELNDDGLGNPAHALLSTKAQDPDIAKLFLAWMVWAKGGQRVIRQVTVDGVPLHGVSPSMTSIFRGLQRAML